MNWMPLQNMQDWHLALEKSNEQLVLVFKHSTRCHISAVALRNFEADWHDKGILPFYLDLIAHRDISNQIAADMYVEHQSPQLILIKNKKAIYHSSHSDIDFGAVVAQSNN